MKNDIQNIWEKLELNIAQDFNKLRLESCLPLNCYLAILNSTNTRCFELEIGNSKVKSFQKKFRGVEIYLLEISPNKKSIFIYLLDNDLSEVFDLFIEDLLKNIEGLTDGEKAFKVIQNQFGKWGKLFAKIKGELLSKERQRGLYGELTFLNTLLNRSNDFVMTISSWTGPEGSNQDFSNGLSAVEVKSSRATKPTVNIASELQLDWTTLDNLYLHVIHLDELNNGSDTLKKLIEMIKHKVEKHPNSLRLFEEKLDLVGIHFGEEKHYDDLGFIIRSQRAYKVQNGFPVLINDTINNDAIHNVKYQVDLTALEPFETELESVISKMI
ncbi:PD-(D/E)XK motif protein [Flavobacteriaceae sp. LMIT009]